MSGPMTSEEMRILEYNAQYLGIELGFLMQNAGREVARVIEQREDLEGKSVVILCGHGGNGGDGMVAARYLKDSGADVEVYLIGRESNISSPDTSLNWGILKKLKSIPQDSLKTESSVRGCKALKSADIIIDALLGFGLTSKVREPVLTAVEMINKAPGTKYAVDVPTGLDSDTGEVYGKAVKANVTITLHATKKGLLSSGDYTGDVVVVSIGIPSDAVHVCGPGDLWLFNRPRSNQSKKGDFGRILVVGGSDIYSGAPALSALASLRTGADLVSVLSPRPVVSAIRSYSPNLMVQGMDTDVFGLESVSSAIEAATRNDVIAIGPGLGLHDATKGAVIEFVKELSSQKKSMVIDADAIKALSKSNIRLNPEESVLTPHWGELSILLDKDIGSPRDLGYRLERAFEAASEFMSVVLLKGPVDIIAAPGGRYKLNHTGVPAMTVGGTGDVLTGIVSTLLARGHGAFYAACAGAFISGRAGGLAHELLGNHLIATDVIEHIPAAMK